MQVDKSIQSDYIHEHFDLYIIRSGWYFVPFLMANLTLVLGVRKFRNKISSSFGFQKIAKERWVLQRNGQRFNISM
jgi:hypothetical protein